MQSKRQKAGRSELEKELAALKMDAGQPRWERKQIKKEKRQIRKTKQLADELDVVQGVAYKALKLEGWDIDKARACCRDVVMEDCSAEVQQKLQLTGLEAA